MCFTWFPNWLFQENPIYNRIWANLQEYGILLGGLSDWWCHLRVHLGKKASNYFMYDERPKSDPPPSLFRAPASESDLCIGPHQ